MNLDRFKPLTVYTIYIASTPEKVWQALTSAEFSRKYFFGNSVDVDLRVGGAYVVRTPDGSLHISGEVIECELNRKLTVTFKVNWPALVEKLGATLSSLKSLLETGQPLMVKMAPPERMLAALKRKGIATHFSFAGAKVVAIM